jgi:hypothetical protein
MEWIAALLPLTTAVACTAAFFLAGRESQASGPPVSPGSPSLTPQAEPYRQNEPLTLTTPGQISIEWRRPTGPSSRTSPASLPIRHLAVPLPASGTRSSEVEETSPSVPPPEEPQSTPAVSEQPPIWLSHWASNSPVQWLSGSDTAQLPRVSIQAPLALVGGPASSPWWAPGHASLSRTSANAYSPERNSPRDSKIAPDLGHLPPWARN